MLSLLIHVSLPRFKLYLPTHCHGISIKFYLFQIIVLSLFSSIILVSTHYIFSHPLCYLPTSYPSCVSFYPLCSPIVISYTPSYIQPIVLYLFNTFLISFQLIMSSLTNPLCYISPTLYIVTHCVISILTHCFISLLTLYVISLLNCFVISLQNVTSHKFSLTHGIISILPLLSFSLFYSLSLLTYCIISTQL